LADYTIDTHESEFSEATAFFIAVPRARAASPNREVLLTAIAKVRNWIDDLVEGRIGSFAEIAKREGKVERHIRLLAPLASRIAETAMVETRVTDLAKAPNWVWMRQEEWFGVCLDEEDTRPNALPPQRR
jgi:hypothetical protein